MSDPAQQQPSQSGTQTEQSRPRWPVILGSLLAGFLLIAVGLGLGWYLFYRPIVNVAVQLPAPPPPPALPGPDQAQVKALEDQIDKQKTANKQIEDQIAALKDRLRADVCTPRDPQGRQLPNQSPIPTTPGERKTEAAPPGIIPATAPPPGTPPPTTQALSSDRAKPGDLPSILERSTVLVLTRAGSGSGFFISPNTVVTNRHVVANTPPGGEVYLVSKALRVPHVGRLVLTSPAGQGDFAIVRVEQQGTSVQPIALAEEPAALREVVAAGYPAIAIAQDSDLRRLASGDMKAAPQVILTKGTVSAVQNKERNAPIVLHSAEISSGNSGGPLVDQCGRVVGVNTFGVTGQSTMAKYALGSSWLAGFLRSARSSFDWRAEACT